MESRKFVQIYQWMVKGWRRINLKSSRESHAKERTNKSMNLLQPNLFTWIIFNNIRIWGAAFESKLLPEIFIKSFLILKLFNRKCKFNILFLFKKVYCIHFTILFDENSLKYRKLVDRARSLKWNELILWSVNTFENFACRWNTIFITKLNRYFAHKAEIMASC